MRTHFRATERHLPCGITQGYLPPDTGERIIALTTARQVSTRFTYPGRMEGWVDLVRMCEPISLYIVLGAIVSKSVLR